MPRQWGMNPILLKTLIQLAASNKKPAPTGAVGSDAQLKNRIVLFSDEPVTLPDWGISGLPSMILGAAPQTCLFVSDLSVDGDADDGSDADNSNDTAASGTDNDETTKASGTVSFSLTIKSPPAEGSSLQARTIVWKLTLPVAGYRDVQTGASSAAVHAPVIKSRIKLGGVERDVEIGLLEMTGLDQPLLIGKDTLADKFLIRPDRPDDQKAPAPPSVDLNPAQPEAPKPKDTPDQTPASNDTPAPAASPATTPAADSAAPKPAAAADTTTPTQTDAPAASDTTPATSTDDEASTTTDNAVPAQSAEQPADNTPKPKAEPTSNDTPAPVPTNATDDTTDPDASKGSDTADSASDTTTTDATPTTDTPSKQEDTPAPTAPPAEPAADTTPKPTEAPEPKPVEPEQNPA
ncbi:hypothetical protein [Thalassospira sp. HJ]|uniref:hypothetical protein n=1 Tax=Thalassospira sp. HJ TaxID=1616823 RepID=UPI0006963370|nr:hypothetical protein [Thalassospira sp. HJ]